MSDPVRAAIVAKLESVPNIGKVHPYQRYADDMEKLAQLFVIEKQLLGWYVARKGIAEERDGCQRRVTVDWQIVGFRGWSDADQSQLLFDDLVDAIREAFRTTKKLGDAEPRGPSKAGIQVEDDDSVLFANVLCHRVRLALQTTQFIDVT